MGVLLLCIQLNAQTKHISGKVSTEDGTPLPGVTIINKKTSKIVGITDGSGTFDLKS